MVTERIQHKFHRALERLHGPWCKRPPCLYHQRLERHLEGYVGSGTRQEPDLAVCREKSNLHLFEKLLVQLPEFIKIVSPVKLHKGSVSWQAVQLAIRMAI